MRSSKASTAEEPAGEEDCLEATIAIGQSIKQQPVVQTLAEQQKRGTRADQTP
jgi:hypothetical protein